MRRYLYVSQTTEHLERRMWESRTTLLPSLLIARCEAQYQSQTPARDYGRVQLHVSDTRAPCGRICVFWNEILCIVLQFSFLGLNLSLSVCITLGGRKISKRPKEGLFKHNEVFFIDFIEISTSYRLSALLSYFREAQFWLRGLTLFSLFLSLCFFSSIFTTFSTSKSFSIGAILVRGFW